MAAIPRTSLSLPHRSARTPVLDDPLPHRAVEPFWKKMARLPPLVPCVHVPLGPSACPFVCSGQPVPILLSSSSHSHPSAFSAPCVASCSVAHRETRTPVKLTFLSPPFQPACCSLPSFCHNVGGSSLSQRGISRPGERQCMGTACIHLRFSLASTLRCGSDLCHLSVLVCRVGMFIPSPPL